MTTLLWFRRDLRLDDHPALLAAAHGPGGESRDVLGVFVADDQLLNGSGSPRRNFLAGCLDALSESMGGRLLIVHGRPEKVIPQLAAKVDAKQVHISADYGPYGRARDERVEKALQDKNVELVTTGSAYAIAPGRVNKPDGKPYAVFTPYFRGWTAHGWRKPAGSGDSVQFVDPAGLGRSVASEKVSAALSKGMELPEPGEAAARKAWSHFLETAVAAYDDERNRPDHPGTSHMSPYLKWGCIHPRTLLADLARRRSVGADSYQRELAFRDFYADILFHRPDTLTVSADLTIDRLDWDTGKEADERFEAWKLGRTGYPYVDAGMRQLLAEGWIHNRVRMGVASFLIKDLHLAWQLGAAHFMDHLVDGDIASNTHGWQWVAGAGAQASPYYRVFNPISQGEKFDPDGDYVRRYIPELAAVAGKAVHRPWDLPDGVPKGYAPPIVDHAAERTETLRRWEQRPHTR
ncbi:deoxyribodipyrimidine photo-lyase [Nakamurella sp. UYEF19]|uniref:cryptochrome/photolyase family protein n=1 Tax=Nakamurella sp. UYEF19 TaxID=1756392 RepID=UPI0033945D5C